jgi:DNA repair protein RadC
MRERFMSAGDFDSFAEHEVIEILLYYIIPRKNTNVIAHNMLDKFDSFLNMLDADVTALSHVEGMGEASAEKLYMLNRIIKYIEALKLKRPNIHDKEAFTKYVHSLFERTNIESTQIFDVDSFGCINGHCIMANSTNLKMFIRQVVLHTNGRVAIATYCNDLEKSWSKVVNNALLAYKHLNFYDIRLTDFYVLDSKNMISLREKGFFK